MELPYRDHCVGCKPLQEALKRPSHYGFETQLDLARCAFRYCKNPGAEPRPTQIGFAADGIEESLCDFGQVLFKADAIAGAVRYLKVSEKEAEEILGYTSQEG